MENTTLERLNALNRDFYDTFARAFADSRGPTEPGLARVLEGIAPGDRVLDLGCGNGRLALLLPAGCTYTGADFSAEMLAVARAHVAAEGRAAHFIHVDLMQPDWPAAFPQRYDGIIMRAVLHHLPGMAHRQRVLSQAATLLQPGGALIIANWQFMAVARLRERVQPWAEIGLTTADVEPGDYLLDWRREGRGLRYVHLVDEAETHALAQAAGLTVAALFRADGREGNLTLYAVLRRTR